MFSGHSLELLLAVLTICFSAVATTVCVRGVLEGRAKPYVWAWLVRLGLSSIALVSQIAQGATYSLALAGALVLSGAAIVGVILYKNRQFGRPDRLDRHALVIAVAGVAIWVLSGNELFGLIGVFIAQGGATAMGIKEAVQHSREESILFWSMAGTAAALAAITASSKGFLVMLAPLFSTTNALVIVSTTLIIRSRNRQKRLALQESA